MSDCGVIFGDQVRRASIRRKSEKVGTLIWFQFIIVVVVGVDPSQGCPTHTLAQAEIACVDAKRLPL